MPSITLGRYPGKIRLMAGIQYAAKLKQKTMNDVADEALIHRSTLYDRFNHPGDFRIDELVSIAKSIGMDPVDLVKILLRKEEEKCSH